VLRHYPGKGELTGRYTERIGGGAGVIRTRWLRTLQNLKKGEGFLKLRGGGHSENHFLFNSQSILGARKIVHKGENTQRRREKKKEIVISGFLERHSIR